MASTDGKVSRARSTASSDTCLDSSRRQSNGECLGASCRHWYAIRFLLKGGKLFALQRYLGHESLEVVKVYAYFTVQDAEEEKRKFSPANDVQFEGQHIRQRGFRNG